MKLATNAFWIGLPGWMKRGRTPVRAAQANRARPVNSGPWSMTADRHHAIGPPADRAGKQARRAGARLARRRSRSRPEVGQKRRALPGGVVDQAQAAKAAAGPQRVARKVHRPALVAPRGRDPAQAFWRRRSAPPSTAQRQIVHSLQAADPLAVDHPTLLAQQRVQSPRAEPPMLPGELVQSGPVDRGPHPVDRHRRGAAIDTGRPSGRGRPGRRRAARCNGAPRAAGRAPAAGRPGSSPGRPGVTRFLPAGP